MTYAANLSTMYGYLPLTGRAAAASADGYMRVESWWDFDSATPPQQELDGFAESLEWAGVELIALNSHGGDRAAGERGLASLPDREEEFAASIAAIAAMAQRVGVKKFNVAAGNLDQRFSREEQLSVAGRRYRYAADLVAGFGGTILIEPLSVAGNPDYPFRNGYDIAEFIDREAEGRTNIGLLFDTFHLTNNGVDLNATWQTLLPYTKHLQLADAPGRGAPGTGSIDFPGFLAAVESSDYQGEISLEYLPATD
ncbi:TIM barrel protein [Psychromicrobium xiongbiense]|uniref:TIM barrel protein n=1 Tax=Psychromicrobium xiongbiense TaxID=3051184 RepID=UPI00255369A9|nr:TIM barrel protein [Psychromicrobium sp. YIM S02556]